MYQYLIKRCSIFALISHAAFAQPVTCPSAEMIKDVHFIAANAHHRDNTLWYLSSDKIVHADQVWSVTFGFFSYTSKNSEQALIEGKKHFESISLKRKNPKPIWIPSGWFCDYMSEGSEFLVSANSPPLSVAP